MLRDALKNNNKVSSIVNEVFGLLCLFSSAALKFGLLGFVFLLFCFVFLHHLYLHYLFLPILNIPEIMCRWPSFMQDVVLCGRYVVSVVQVGRQREVQAFC